MTKDYRLNANWDIEFVDGELNFTTEEETLLQRIKQRMQFFRGEWFLNEAEGIPYFEEIFQKNYDLSRIEAIYINELQRIDGVAEILSLEINVNDSTREMTIEGQIREESTGEIIDIAL